MADIHDETNTSTISGAARNTTHATQDVASGVVTGVADVLETTVHAAGNIGVTTMMELIRVLSTTVVGVRQTVGSVVTGITPDFADLHQKETDFRKSRL